MQTLRLPILSAVAVAALLASSAALAQSSAAPVQTAPGATSSQPPASAPAASSQAPTASTGAAANANATTSSTAQLTPGLTVKDRTGAAIGQIADISTDTKTGQQLATIQMGSESFRLPTDRLGVFNGAANVNLTQADIEAQLHPAKR
jgi:hypothetical protein